MENKDPYHNVFVKLKLKGKMDPTLSYIKRY